MTMQHNSVAHFIVSHFNIIIRLSGKGTIRFIIIIYLNISAVKNIVN